MQLQYMQKHGVNGHLCSNVHLDSLPILCYAKMESCASFEVPWKQHRMLIKQSAAVAVCDNVNAFHTLLKRLPGLTDQFEGVKYTQAYMVESDILPAMQTEQPYHYAHYKGSAASHI